ncbi:MAG: metalloregulator ArsR/SmtB family transcription factor [Oscillospiraceae bacterium]|nr:metalloregulator ArsR/SmtB family transcription factor [Oscillospiraceae bacterium]
MTDSYETCLNVFRALSDPTRLEIILLIKDADSCARDLLEHFSFSQPTLSYHMKILTEAGLVTARKEGLWVRYFLNREHLDCVIRILSAVTKEVRSTGRVPQTERGRPIPAAPHRKE